ncbi:MAG: DUF1552 domain-containing protein [Acidobacteria bacterium]|nr:DUF1552 domain-containing protein [Acidobacteriota bacterium]TDI26457.1 MAG: DUF1552 domain-containing protein [Acidobacteriota bacterium]
MFITRMHLPRRTVLRGLGATLALPLLDCMVPALTAQSRTAAAPIKRFGVFYVPNGMSMPYWYPKTEGPLDELPPTLRPLEAFKDRVLLCGGLDDESANLVKGGGDHARSAGTFLTCVPYKITNGADVSNAVSMDQIAARELSKETQLASLELGIESNAMLGNCDGGASCAYTNTIAWRTPTTPLPIENDPRAVFERMFGTSGSTDPEARLARMRRDRSILDLVGDELHGLERVVGPGDQVKLAEYLEALRDIERRIEMAERQNTRELPVVDQPVGVPNDYAEHARIMMDLLALAYQTDLTRISTFMLAREVSGRAYPQIGVSDSHHPLSHHQDEPAKLERLHRINEFHVQQFAYLVAKLDALPEGDGSMLDSTLFLYGTGISDSNTHFHDDLPIVLVGGRNAGIKGGRYIRYPKDTPLANLHVSILEKLGVPVEAFGDSTGPLDRLTGV